MCRKVLLVVLLFQAPQLLQGMQLLWASPDHGLRSRSRLRARSRSLLESVSAFWFSGEAIACLLAVTVLRVLHLVAGAFIFFRGGVVVAASPVVVAAAVAGAAVAEAAVVVLAAAAPVKGAAVAESAAVALAAAAPLEGAAVTEKVAVVLAASVPVRGAAVAKAAAVALAAAVAQAAEVGPDPDAWLFCLFSQAFLLFFGKPVVSLQLKVTSSIPPPDTPLKFSTHCRYTPNRRVDTRH